MSNTDLYHTTKKNTIVSAASLFFQSGYSAFLGMIVNFILPAIINLTNYGIYITTLSIIAILNYFSDIGLAASLIQKKELSEEDIVTTFTIQQILIITLITIGFLLTPIVKSFYKLPTEGAYLYWALLFSFFISSLKTIPSVLLERKIQFQKIVLVQIIENTTFYITVIIFALSGFELRSFTYSVLLRALIGLITMYYLSFWRPRLGISRSSMKQLFAFGLPFQATSFIALFKDDLIILYLSKMLGFEAIGYLGWAKKWAEASIRIVMDNISKVMFPLIARYQDDRNKVGQILSRIYYYQTAIIAPALAGTFMIMPLIVAVVPKYGKFTVALPFLYIFIFSSFFVSLSSPIINIFNSLGKVRYTLTYMIAITVITWIFTPFLITRYGPTGFPIAHLFVSISSLAVIVVAKKFISFSIIEPLYRFVISAICMAVCIYILRIAIPEPSLPLIIGAIALGGVIYILLLHLVFRLNLHEEARRIILHK